MHLIAVIGSSLDVCELTACRAPGVATRRVDRLLRGTAGHDTGLWPLPHGPGSVAVCEWRGRPVVVAAGGFPEARLWDLRDGEEIDHRLACDGEVFTASALPHGERVFVLTDADHAEPDYTVRLFDLDSGELIHPEVTDGARTGVLGVHDGRPVVVLSGDDGRIRVWDLGNES